MLNKTRAGMAAICAVAALAFVVIAGGVTYAATKPAPATTITACVHHSGGGLYKAAKCAKGDSSLTWNVKGQAGPTGPAGLSLFVRADETGAMHQHSPGVTVQKLSTGLYQVSFTQNISQCAAVVSQGEASNNGFIPGTFYLAVVQSDPFNGGSPHEVNVYPTNSAGTPVDAGFDLILAC
jgi:hypothetical protein